MRVGLVRKEGGSDGGRYTDLVSSSELRGTGAGIGESISSADAIGLSYEELGLDPLPRRLPSPGRQEA